MTWRMSKKWLLSVPVQIAHDDEGAGEAQRVGLLREELARLQVHVPDSLRAEDVALVRRQE